MVALSAQLQQRRIRLRNVRAGNHLGNIHHGEQGRSGSRHLPRIQRTVGDHAIDRTANLGVAKLRARSEILSLRRLQLPRR